MSCVTKKADVAEHPQVLSHVGLLVNEPPGQAELLFIQSPNYGHLAEPTAWRSLLPKHMHSTASMEEGKL